MVTMRKVAKVALFMVTIFVATAPVGVTAQELADEQVLRIAGTRSDIRRIHADGNGSGGEAIISDMIHNGLVRWPTSEQGIAELAYEPDLAKSWEVSEDKRTWTFYLREGVQFHHGYGELTAADVEFTYEVASADPAYARDWSVYSDWEIEAVDRYTVKITIPTPDPLFLRNVADFGGGQIISKKAFQERGLEAWRLNPIGTGPFQLAKYQPREYILMERHEDYFRGAPILENVELRFMDLSSAELAMQAGKIHLLVEGPTDQQWVERMEKLGLDVVPASSGGMLIAQFDTSREPFDDIRVRKAFLHGIDEKAIVDNLFGTVVANYMVSPIPSSWYGATEDVPRYEYNPEKAKELLAEAGYEDGLTVDSIMSESPSMLYPALAIQDQLRKIGVDLVWNVVDHTSYYSRIKEGYNRIALHNATRPPFGDIVFDQFYHGDAIVGKPTAVTNYAHYDGVDHLIEEARTTADSDKQLRLWSQAQRQIMEDAIVQPVAVRFWLFAKQPSFDVGYDLNKYRFTPDPLITIDERARILRD